MIPGRKLAPLALAVISAIFCLPVSAKEFNNPAGDVITTPWTDSLLAVGIGNGNSGKLTILSDVTTDKLQVGLDSARAIVDINNGGRLTVLNESYIGGELMYQKVINSNGHTSFVRSNMFGEGTLNVSGKGSEFNAQSLIIGSNTGDGTLNISEGGKVNVAHNLTLAEQDSWAYFEDYENGSRAMTTAAQGFVNVDGAGSELHVGGNIMVGEAAGSNRIGSDFKEGYSAITITNGGKVHADGFVAIGDIHTGLLSYPQENKNKIVVTGQGSELSSSSQILVGVDHTQLYYSQENLPDFLIVADGGAVTAPTATLVKGRIVVGGYSPVSAEAPGSVNINDIHFGVESIYSGGVEFNHTDNDYIFNSNIISDVAGAGYIYAYNGNTKLTGDNTAFTGNAVILPDGEITISEQKEIGSATLNIRPDKFIYNDSESGGIFNIKTNHDWEFVNKIDGFNQSVVANYHYFGGTLAVDANGNRFSIKSADLMENFSGILSLKNTLFELADVNTAALKYMLLRVGEQSVVTLGEGQQNIDRFDIDGGTVIFGDVAAGESVAQNTIHTTGSLDISGSGTVQVNPVDVLNVTPTVAPDIPLLAQDDGNALILLASSGGIVKGSGGGLALVDANGQAISDERQSNIVQNGNVAAIGSYDYRLTSGNHQDGLYINYGLKAVELLAKGSDALVLNANGGIGNAADLSARVTGDGDLAITGKPGETVSLSNGNNDYTGKTEVRSGALAMHNNNVLGKTSSLMLASNSDFVMNGHAQTVGTLEANAGSRIDLGGGSLTIANGGTSAGALVGKGELTISDGTLNVNGANTELSAATVVAKSATAKLDNAQGLGSGDIRLAGTLSLDGAKGSISNAFSGSGNVQLANSDIALAGKNETFSGRFSIDSLSSLAASAASHLGDASVENAGTLLLNASDAWKLENTLTGTGSLQKTGQGTVILTSESAGLSGLTSVVQGELQLGDGQDAVTLASMQTVVGSEGRLSGFGGTVGDIFNQGVVSVGRSADAGPGSLSVGGDFRNSGQVRFAEGYSVPGNRLVVEGDYVGEGGALYLNTVLGDDRSATDRMFVKGDTSGTTAVHVTNAGGGGAQTLNGIEVISVDGHSEGEFTQGNRIVAGTYDYSLVRGRDDNASNWYLTSNLVSGGGDNGGDVTPGIPEPDKISVIRPEAGVYAANLAASNTLFATRRHERTGDRLYIDAASGELKETSMWMRNVGGHTRSKAGDGQLKTTENSYVLQMGGELAAGSINGQDRWNIGAMAGYGHSKSNTRSVLTDNRAEGNVNGYSVGIYGGWNADEVNHYGAYVDGWVQYGWFNNTLKGNGIQGESWKSSGFTASAEAGYTRSLGHFNGSNGGKTEWLVQPQAQVTWMGVQADDHREANGTKVKGQGDGNIQTRLGFRTMLRGHSALDEGKSRQFQPYAELNWIHNTKSFGAEMNGISVSRQGANNAAELKVGVEGQVSKNLSLWGNIGEQIGDKGYSDTTGMIGIKYHF
ncbi:autotransporter outer membrane beta-barrel domain-containing protein [Enterobacter sp. KBR-315C3_2022]|uniref:autotransporter outer membrane beta-barrel domain-containing protein n=1 Tax=Enterobacter sp. KBR-315C3_2022 TaxID=3242494 RepID=UPI00352917F4